MNVPPIPSMVLPWKTLCVSSRRLECWAESPHHWWALWSGGECWQRLTSPRMNQSWSCQQTRHDQVGGSSVRGLVDSDHGKAINFVLPRAGVNNWILRAITIGESAQSPQEIWGHSLLSMWWGIWLSGLTARRLLHFLCILLIYWISFFTSNKGFFLHNIFANVRLNCGETLIMMLKRKSLLSLSYLPSSVLLYCNARRPFSARYQ